MRDERDGVKLAIFEMPVSRSLPNRYWKLRLANLRWDKSTTCIRIELIQDAIFYKVCEFCGCKRVINRGVLICKACYWEVCMQLDDSAALFSVWPHFLC